MKAAREDYTISACSESLQTKVNKSRNKQVFTSWQGGPESIRQNSLFKDPCRVRIDEVETSVGSRLRVSAGISFNPYIQNIPLDIFCYFGIFLMGERRRRWRR